MNNDQLRGADKGHNGDEVTAMNILCRRSTQMAAAKWLAKWSYPLQGVFFLIGFFVVFLPVVSGGWRQMIEALSITAWIYNQFSTLGVVALLLLMVIMVPFIILNVMVKDYPGGWDPTKEWGFPSPKEIVEKSLYPERGREVFVFWVGIVFGVIGTATMLYFPFGLMAFFFRIGG